MSKTPELPIEIWLLESDLKRLNDERPLAECELSLEPQNQYTGDKDIPYIRKDIHESEMDKCWKSGNENYELLMCRKNAHIEYLKSELERVKVEMQKEIDLLKFTPTSIGTINQLGTFQKTCDCKLKLSASANFLCHGQCKY